MIRMHAFSLAKQAHDSNCAEKTRHGALRWSFVDLYLSKILPRTSKTQQLVLRRKEVLSLLHGQIDHRHRHGRWLLCA